MDLDTGEFSPTPDNTESEAEASDEHGDNESSDLALNDDADDSIELKLTVAENGDDEDEDNRDPNFPPETLL